jgi:hypothetical protein
MDKKTRAEIELAMIDADVARWYVHDGQLSESPLNGMLSEEGQSLRRRRLVAVQNLRLAGGSDPHPSFLNPPTDAQREGWENRHGLEERVDHFLNLHPQFEKYFKKS